MVWYNAVIARKAKTNRQKEKELILQINSLAQGVTNLVTSYHAKPLFVKKGSDTHMENTPDMVLVKLRDIPDAESWLDAPAFEETKVIAYKPQLANYLQSIESAIYFQQLSHWQKYSKRSDGFIYKTAKEIEEETYISEKKQRRCREQLKALGWIKVEKKMANGSPTYHFKVMVKTFGVLIPTGKTPVPTSQNASSITKNTHEKNYSSEMTEQIEKVYDAWLKLMVVDPAVRVHGTTDERRDALKAARNRTRLTDLRKAKVATRIKSMGLERVIQAIRQISKSEFHRDGIQSDGTKGTFVASLEWLCDRDERVESWANKGGSE